MMQCGILHLDLATVQVTLRNVPTIDVRDSSWAIFAALMSAATGLATVGLAFATFRLAGSTRRSLLYETIREQRAARPIIVARIRIRNTGIGTLRDTELLLSNKGSTALYVLVYWESPGVIGSGKTRTIQVIGHGEDISAATGLPVNPELSLVRIRYSDYFSNSYITEYKVLSEDPATAQPIFRLPQLEGEAKPRFWSGEVGWPTKEGEMSSIVDGKAVPAYEIVDAKSPHR